MHKLILSGGINYLDRFTDDVYIEVKKHSTLNIVNLGSKTIKIKILEGITLDINMFDITNNVLYNLDIEEESNSTLNLNVAFISEGKYELNIDNTLNGSNINTNVNIRGINETNGTVKILMNGIVKDTTYNNILNEYARIINKSTMSNVLIPNLIVNSKEVIANHGVSVGSIDNNQIYYLMSKGLSKLSAKKLLEEGFILSNIDGEMKEQIKNILIGR